MLDALCKFIAKGKEKIIVMGYLPLIFSFAALLVSITSCSIQSKELNLSEVVTELETWGRKNEEMANSLNAALVNNSNTELEIQKKKVSFEIIQKLYEELYHFSDSQRDVIR